MQNKKKRLFIVGASSFGRELESWLELETEKDFYLEGYLDKNLKALDGFYSDYAVVGDEDTFDFLEDDYVLLGIADVEVRARIYEKLRGRVQFYTFVSSQATVGKFTNIGEGCVICPGCIITTSVEIEAGVIVNIGTQIGHDSKIGIFSSLMANVDLGGGVKLGKKVFVGTGAIVIPGKKVEEKSFVGAGSVVIRNVKKGTKVFGNPARKI